MPTDPSSTTGVPTSTIVPPEQFNFAKPEDSPNWIRRYSRYRIASGLDKKDDSIQVNLLLYTMGDEADDIMTSFIFDSPDDNVKYDKVKEKIDNHFVVRRNTIYERAKFNQRVQGPDEPVDSFITALYCLVEFCEYGSLRDEMIRDRLVVGLQNAKLSERLQMDATLSLEKAVNMARQSERNNKKSSATRAARVTKKLQMSTLSKVQVSRETRNKNLEEGRMSRSRRVQSLQIRHTSQRARDVEIHSTIVKFAQRETPLATNVEIRDITETMQVKETERDWN